MLYDYAYMYIFGVFQVADCVCLMSLDKHDVVPVDTHVWQIAQKYLPSLKNSKTMTPQVYDAVGEHLQILLSIYTRTCLFYVLLL